MLLWQTGWLSGSKYLKISYMYHACARTFEKRNSAKQETGRDKERWIENCMLGKNPRVAATLQQSDGASYKDTKRIRMLQLLGRREGGVAATTG